MAARKHLSHIEKTREKIRASMLLNRLQSFVEGKQGVEMKPHQVTAALGLLKKVIPDLSTVALTGEDGGPVETVTRVELVAGGDG